MTPPDQKNRPIGFYLTGGTGGILGIVLRILPIRPESISYPEPARLDAEQSLGGGWLDAFGRGIPTFTIRGSTGWRGGILSSGEDAILDLRDTVFIEWNKRRQEAIANGTDPDDVKLYYADTLNHRYGLCAVNSFVLERSRSSPLLSRYTITFTMLDDGDSTTELVDSIVTAITNPLRFLGAVTGLTSAIATVSSALSLAQAAFGAIATGIGNFALTGASLLQSLATTATSLRGQFDSTGSVLLSIGSIYTRAGANAFAALGAGSTLPAERRLAVARIASAYNDAACVIETGLKQSQAYPNYDDVYGASGCSSTGGGRPASAYAAADANPFTDIFSASTGDTASAILSTDGAAALASLNGDPINLIGETSMIGDLLTRAAAGVTVA